jgi:hypothetical protein
MFASEPVSRLLMQMTGSREQVIAEVGAEEAGPGGGDGRAQNTLR